MKGTLDQVTRKAIDCLNQWMTRNNNDREEEYRSNMNILKQLKLVHQETLVGTRAITGLLKDERKSTMDSRGLYCGNSVI